MAPHSPPALPDEAALDLAFPALLRGLTQKADIPAIQALCQTIVGYGRHGSWEHLFKTFFDELVRTRDALPPHVLHMEETLSPDWFCEPWYLLYVHNFGVEDGEEGGFKQLRRTLPYVRDFLGFRNLCLLPHYESPMADDGYDVSAYVARESMGGELEFEAFMEEAVKSGMRVVTDAVFNHTSTEHAWFQRALSGDDKYLSYYLQRNGREKIAEFDRGGDIVCRYRDPDGTITERVVVFPDVDRTHGLWAEIRGKTYQFYREFHPFQVDLDLQNPAVLAEILAVLGREVRQGVVGKRADAAAHWIKKPGTAAEGLVEGHAVLALLKAFLKHANKRAVLLPEVVLDMPHAVAYAGHAGQINGEPCVTEGDALFAFEMQAALRETTYLQTVAPLWRCLFLLPSLPSSATWLNLLEHHDETFLGFFSPDVRRWVRDYITTHSGIVFKNGLSAGGRLADCLNHSAQRIATALFLLYLTPGTPLVYAGTELCSPSDLPHAQAHADSAHALFRRLGVYTPPHACFDPRQLQRAPLPRRLLDDARKGVSAADPAVQVVRRLNALWREAAWLRSNDARPLDCGDIGVVSMGRGGGNAEGGGVVCLANLMAARATARIPVAQAGEHWGREWRAGVFVDVMTGGPVEVEVGQKWAEVKMDGFFRAVIRVGRAREGDEEQGR